MYCAKCRITVGDDHMYCHRCGGALVAKEPAPPVMTSATDPDADELLSLKSRLSDLEARLPKSNIISQKFWSRAFTVLGHSYAALFAIAAVMAAVMLVIRIIGAIFGKAVPP